MVWVEGEDRQTERAFTDDGVHAWRKVFYRTIMVGYGRSFSWYEVLSAVALALSASSVSRDMCSSSGSCCVCHSSLALQRVSLYGKCLHGSRNTMRSPKIVWFRRWWVPKHALCQRADETLQVKLNERFTPSNCDRSGHLLH